MRKQDQDRYQLNYKELIGSENSKSHGKFTELNGRSLIKKIPSMYG